MKSGWNYSESINQTKPEGDSASQMQNIQILDLSDPNFAQKIVQIYKEIGFVIIENHGISHQHIDQAFSRAKELFVNDKGIDKAVGFNKQKNRGYSGPGEEVLGDDPKGEKRQTLDLGHPEGPQEIGYYPKNTPPETLKFMGNFYKSLFQVYTTIMEGIEKGLGVEKGSIVSKCCNDFYNQTLRLLYYPEVSYQQIKQAGRVRTGMHSDYGTVTLLFQKPGKGQNGLRALNADKKWVKVNPPDYCMVVNLGDMFQHWTNDFLKSTIHKVEVDEQVLDLLEKKEIQNAPQRQTIVMFCDPDRGHVFESLQGFGQNKYGTINGKQYALGRVKATYESKS